MSEAKDDDDPGIRCPKCWCRWSRITHTIKLPRGRIRRRRVCQNPACGRAYATLELHAKEAK